MMSCKNRFNGYYLEYNISKDLFYKIRKTIHKDGFTVFNNNGDEIWAKPDIHAVLPIGIFSNKFFKLECDNWELTDRKYKVEMESPVKSTIQLTDVQKEIVKIFFENCEDIQKNNLCPIYLNLVGQCSIGKTIMSVEILSRIKYKTLIITPSKDLAKQWGDTIKEFLIDPDYHVSMLGASMLLKNLKHPPDILLVPSKHLANESFVKYIMQNYSVCFIDEQHSYNLETNKTMKKFFAFNSFPFVFSLTATPRPFNTLYLGREINLEEIIKIMKPDTFRKELYEIVIPRYKLIRYCDEYKKYLELCKKNYLTKDEVMFKSLMKKKSLSEDYNRFQAIVKNVKQVQETENDSKTIILTHFVYEIEKFYDELINNGLKNVYKIFAASKNNEETSLSFVKEDIKNKKSYILIGTEDHLGTGIDVKELSILHLANMPTNRNNIIQYAGRVSRDNDTPVHKIFYYNISSYPKINLDKNSDDLHKILRTKNWIYEKKMLF